MKFQALLKKMEFEGSLKCDHELRKEKDKRHAELIKGLKNFHWIFS